jgi:hypothetical protein
MYSTNTGTPEWMVECDTFIKSGRDFEVHNVTNVEDLNYLKLLSATYNLNWFMKGNTLRLVRPVDQPIA